MEEKSRFAQILIFWDAVLLGTLIFISLSVKPGLRCLWLHSAMLAECAIGLLILGILTFGKSEPDIVHGRLPIRSDAKAIFFPSGLQMGLVSWAGLVVI